MVVPYLLEAAAGPPFCTLFSLCMCLLFVPCFTLTTLVGSLVLLIGVWHLFVTIGPEPSGKSFNLLADMAYIFVALGIATGITAYYTAFLVLQAVFVLSFILAMLFTHQLVTELSPAKSLAPDMVVSQK
jgi:hypothetical protein